MHIREDGTGRVLVPNLSTQSISSIGDFQLSFKQASKARSTSSTHLNHSSSRSHFLVQVTVQCRHPTQKSKCVVGRVNLIDLAGSESYKGERGAVSDRIAEGASINKSLSVLGQVINALNKGLVSAAIGRAAPDVAALIAFE